LFIQRFDTLETPAAMFLNMLTKRPTDGECLALHASRMVTELTTKWREMEKEEIAVSVTLALLASFDNRLQRLSFTSNVRTRSDLQSELKAFTFNKRKSGFVGHQSEVYPKRQKQSSIECHFCGKLGSDRLCVDYRELNSNTVADKYPLPLIQDQIDRLRGANYFTCLDMASGHYQNPLHAGSIKYTAFVTPDGQYEFLSMPFGLKNAVSVFQRLVMQALGDLANSYVIVYMDDIMITATTQCDAFFCFKCSDKGWVFIQYYKVFFPENIGSIFRLQC